MERRNAFVLPRAVPLLEVRFATGIQCTDGLNENIYYALLICVYTLRDVSFKVEIMFRENVSFL